MGLRAFCVGLLLLVWLSGGGVSFGVICFALQSLLTHCPSDIKNSVKAKKDSYLPGFEKKASARHGGDHARGKRKTLRPIDTKQALHMTLKSSKARGALSMLHPNHCNAIEKFVRKTAEKWGVRVYRYANVGNHLHLLIRTRSRQAWKNFAKEISGGIAQIVTGAQKGAALPRTQDSTIPESAKRGFWDGLIFTRIVSFGRDFNGVANYLIKNLFEAAGVPMKKLQAQGYRILLISKDGVISGAPS
jgi:REP element-mobilizing transposase RayT